MQCHYKTSMGFIITRRIYSKNTFMELPFSMEDVFYKNLLKQREILSIMTILPHKKYMNDFKKLINLWSRIKVPVGWVSIQK